MKIINVDSDGKGRQKIVPIDVDQLANILRIIAEADKELKQIDELEVLKYGKR